MNTGMTGIARMLIRPCTDAGRYSYISLVVLVPSSMREPMLYNRSERVTVVLESPAHRRHRANHTPCQLERSRCPLNVLASRNETAINNRIPDTRLRMSWGLLTAQCSVEPERRTTVCAFCDLIPNQL